MRNFIKKHPALSYYLLVFAISWGGTLVLIGGPANIPGTVEQVGKLFFSALIILFCGPFISGILMNFLVGGRQGLRNLQSHLLRWRVNGRWYAIAVFTGPLLVAAVLFGLSIFNRDFLPEIVAGKDTINTLLFGISWGLTGGGLLEETGWTGFVIPRLRQRYSIMYTGLIVGLLWGLWHFMIAFWASNYMVGEGSWTMFVAGFLAFYLLALPAYRVLLVFVYDRTESLPVIMLMHAFLSASTIILTPSATGTIAFTWNLVLGILLWIIVAVVMAKNRKYFLQNPGI